MSAFGESDLRDVTVGSRWVAERSRRVIWRIPSEIRRSETARPIPDAAPRF